MRKKSQSNLMPYRGIFIEGLRKTTKIISHDYGFSNRNLKLGSFEWRSEYRRPTGRSLASF